jgi:hypothetical protein
LKIKTKTLEAKHFAWFFKVPSSKEDKLKIYLDEQYVTNIHSTNL